MLGSICGYGKPCPVCGGAWTTIKDKYGDTVNILCKEHFTMPERYYIDGRPFKNRRGDVGRLFRDEKGRLLYSFPEAKRLLEAVRHDWDKYGPEVFDPTKWSRSGRESYKLSQCVRETMLVMGSKKPPVDTTHMEIAFRLHIIPIIGDLDIREVFEDDIEKLQLGLMNKINPRTKQPYEWNTVKGYMTQLMTVLNRYHKKKHIIPYVPAFPDDWNETRDRDVRTLSVKEQDDIIAIMPERVRPLLDLYRTLGCRPEEVCGLKKGDLLPDGETIRIQRVFNAKGKEVPYTKNRRKREQTIPPEYHAALSGSRTFDREYLFLNDDGEPFNPNRLSAMFRWHADKHGYEDVDLYSFARHSMATETYRKAVKRGLQEAAEKIGNTPGVARVHYIKPCQ